ncbi:MAG: hypothetical protein KDK60_04595 [Chlamydiia bacterium]|nr:hypothetical protein [Chlamydiia bacterium]
MKKYLAVFLIAGACVFANEQEEKGKELCSFTQSVFGILSEESRIVDEEKLQTAYASYVEQLKRYKDDPNPEIASIAGKFIASFQSGERGKGEAVSNLGRLVKCSVDDMNFRVNTSYLLHKEDLQKEIASMEKTLGGRLPEGKRINYHKVMMESLADKEYDLALYAYLKIAESRCTGEE